MKKLIILVLILLLSACAKVDENSLPSELDTFLSDLNYTYNIRQNNSVKYYNYYLPSDMQEMSGNENSAVINFYNSKLVLNLNVKAIVNSRYYQDYILDDEGFFRDEDSFYEHSGSYLKDDENSCNYVLKIYQKDDIYLIYMLSDDVNFYGSSYADELVSFVKHIFTIAKSVEVDRENVINDYSSKDVISYEKKQVDLFDYVIPSDGYLQDLVNTSDGVIQSDLVGESSSGITQESQDEDVEETFEEEEVDEDEETEEE